MSCRTTKHTIPYHILPYHTIPQRTIPYHTVPYHTIPYRTIPCRTVLYRTITYLTIPYRYMKQHHPRGCGNQALLQTRAAASKRCRKKALLQARELPSTLARPLRTICALHCSHRVHHHHRFLLPPSARVTFLCFHVFLLACLCISVRLYATCAL